MKQNVSITVALAVILSVTAISAAELSIATIDLNEVFNNYYKTKVELEKLKGEAKKYEDRLKKLKGDFDKLKLQLERQQKNAADPALAPVERKRREAAMRDTYVRMKELEQSSQNLQRASSEKLLQQRKNVTEDLLKEITDVVKARAKAGKYNFVLDTGEMLDVPSGLGRAVVLFNDGRNDLTGSLLKQLNATNPNKTSAPVNPKKEKTKKGIGKKK